MMPQVVPDPYAAKMLPPVKRATYKATMRPVVMHVSDTAVRFESPIKRFGGRYDGAEASGWHVCLRHDDGSLESLSGPHETPQEASVALARLIGGEPL